MIRSACVLLLGVLFAASAVAEEKPPACGAEWSRAIVDQLLNRDLDQASSVVSHWSVASPGHLSIPLHKALIEVARADYSRDRDTAKYNTALKMLSDVIDQTRAEVKANPDAYLSRLNLATANAVSGRLLMEQHHWIKAYHAGHESREIMLQLLQEDHSRHDTKLILGLFDYFTGTLPKVLRWLTHLIDLVGNEEKGIAYLEDAVRYAEVAAPQAAESLLVELEHTPEQACHYRDLAQTMKAAYPENPRYSWSAVRLKRICSQLPEAERPAAKQFVVAPPSCR